jgi:hypothetical protein
MSFPPTSPLSYPLVDGYRKSFVSIEARFSTPVASLSVAGLNVGASLSLSLLGFKDITMKRTRKRGLARGFHPNPLGKTRGSNEFEATLEMYVDEFNALVAQLSAVNPVAYGDVFFNFSRTYTENGTDTITDTAYGCTLDETDGNDTQSDDPTTRKVSLNPLNILFNGQPDTVQLNPLPI